MQPHIFLHFPLKKNKMKLKNIKKIVQIQKIYIKKENKMPDHETKKLLTNKT